MVPAPYAVTARRQETDDTWTLELRDAAGRGMGFRPGQFTMLSAGGHGEVPISISGDPADADRLVHTVRAVGPATDAIAAAQPRSVLGVRGPFGRPWPVDGLADTHVVVVAGGIGLAPLRPAILQLLARRPALRGLTLLYGGRAPEQLLYTEELPEWERRGLDVRVTVDSATPAWPGRVGVVTRLVRDLGIETVSCTALLCGPEVMMRYAVAALAEQGVAAERTFVSIERNMQCGIGHCGHCQLGPTLICRDGPVYAWDAIGPWMRTAEL
jgi:NAD(P)H-flavin reductase